MDPWVLPLHYLIADSHANWPKYGIEELISAYPAALCIPDPRTGLVPALASAQFASCSSAYLSATFKFLLRSPQVFLDWAATEALKE